MRSTLDAVTRFAQQLSEHAELAELRNRGFQDFQSLEGTDSMLMPDLSNTRSRLLDFTLSITTSVISFTMPSRMRSCTSNPGFR